jgi:hypothetical protein
MSYVVAFDPSTKVLGWCAMDTDSGLVLAHGVEAIDVKDGGWQHDQVHRAVLRVHSMCPLDEPDGWTYELPYAPGQRAAYAYGAVCRSLETACRHVWTSAIAYDPYQMLQATSRSAWPLSTTFLPQKHVEPPSKS